MLSDFDYTWVYPTVKRMSQRQTDKKDETQQTHKEQLTNNNIENYRPSNKNHTKNRKWSYVLRKNKQIVVHVL